jgi:hypothetical protein
MQYQWKLTMYFNSYVYLHVTKILIGMFILHVTIIFIDFFKKL